MSTKDFSNKQEKMIASYLGWEVVKGSGARACHPGDIIGDDWLGECKTHTTPGNPIFFSSSVWSKICDEAAFQHRSPVLFADDGSQTIDKTWCMINQFSVEDGWTKLPLGKKFKTNFTMKHEDLVKLYSTEDITNGIAQPRCYVAGLGRFHVVILPISLFRHMFY